MIDNNDKIPYVHKHLLVLEIDKLNYIMKTLSCIVFVGIDFPTMVGFLNEL